jgi:hypothetical protein
MANIGIVELLTAIGNENIKINPLDQCMKNMQSRKDYNEFTFVSDQAFGFDGPAELGIVVWVSREDAKKILGR